jgi:hypothetical protein
MAMMSAVAFTNVFDVVFTRLLMVYFSMARSISHSPQVALVRPQEVEKAGTNNTTTGTAE